MKKLAITLSMALASLLAVNAYAQNTGGDSADQAKAAPTKAATKDEKAAAKQARKAEGRAIAKSHTLDNDGVPPEPKATKVSKSEKQAAAVKRKAAGVQAQKEQAGKNPLEGSK